MGRHMRRIVLGVIAVCGIVLVGLGIIEGRELLVVGKVPPERLGHQVASTTLPLVVGLGMIVGGLAAGLVRRQRSLP